MKRPGSEVKVVTLSLILKIVRKSCCEHCLTCHPSAQTKSVTNLQSHESQAHRLIYRCFSAIFDRFHLQYLGKTFLAFRHLHFSKEELTSFCQ